MAGAAQLVWMSLLLLVSNGKLCVLLVVVLVWLALRVGCVPEQQQHRVYNMQYQNEIRRNFLRDGLTSVQQIVWGWGLLLFSSQKPAHDMAYFDAQHFDMPCDKAGQSLTTVWYATAVCSSRSFAVVFL
jgi:hypothetical protein